MKIEQIGLDRPEWMHFVENHPEATAFHHPAWAKLLAECYGFRAFVLAMFDEAGKICLGIPFIDVKSLIRGRHWSALPFSDYCAPLYYESANLESVIEYLGKEFRAKAIPEVEIRSQIPVLPSVYRDTRYVWHSVSMNADSDVLFKSFHNRVRKQILQAGKRGVSVRPGEKKKDIWLFFNLVVQTRRRLGVPAQPKRYFELLWERIISRNLGFLLLAYYGSEPIAGTIFLNYNKMLTAKYNASLPEYWKLRANNALYWEAIKWGCENKYHRFDFGRSEVANVSLREYKDRWGTEEVALPYGHISGSPYHPANPFFDKVVNRVIRKSPLWVARLAGEILYKQYA